MKPDFIFESVASLTEEFYLKNKIEAVIFDIDDTLCPHGAKTPSELCEKTVAAAKNAGVKVCFISNNKEERDFFFTPIKRNAKKPSKKGYKELLKEINVLPENALAVGDQLFTDMLGAKSAGIRFTLVKPISNYKNPIIFVKRILEKPFLKSYRRNK